MLQQPNPADYVIATGKTISARTFVEAAFRAINVALTWQGEGADEVGYGTNLTNPSGGKHTI